MRYLATPTRYKCTDVTTNIAVVNTNNITGYTLSAEPIPYSFQSFKTHDHHESSCDRKQTSQQTCSRIITSANADSAAIIGNPAENSIDDTTPKNPDFTLRNASEFVEVWSKWNTPLEDSELYEPVSQRNSTC
jgi:hypothetical protein